MWSSPNSYLSCTGFKGSDASQKEKEMAIPPIKLHSSPPSLAVQQRKVTSPLRNSPSAPTSPKAQPSQTWDETSRPTNDTSQLLPQNDTRLLPQDSDTRLMQQESDTRMLIPSHQSSLRPQNQASQQQQSLKSSLKNPSSPQRAGWQQAMLSEYLDSGK